MKRSLVILTLVVVAVSTLSSCKKENPEVQPEIIEGNRGDLISYNEVSTLSTSDILNITQWEGDFSNEVNYSIKLYSVEYKTMHQGNLVKVSGLVMVPQNVPGDLSIIQYHHGTIMPDESSTAPSLYQGGYSDNTENSVIAPVFASNGYIVSLPDYVGYGVTEGTDHPYTMHKDLATHSVDMIRATRHLMQNLGVSLNGKIMLGGWSEGGGVGLALHKYAQQDYAGEFNILGSSLLAGPYDYKSFIFDVLNNSNQSWGALQIYNWAIYSMNKYSPTLQRASDNIWTYSVASQNDAINIPSYQPNYILKSSFITSILDGSDTEFNAVLEEQTLLQGWVPTGKIFLHSGTDDAIVPHYNSTNAEQAFTAAGADVTLYEYQFGDHYTPMVDYIKTTLTDFESL